MGKKNIGINAGIVWDLLSDKQNWNAEQISKHSGLSEKEVYCAIGWLARENKIEIGDNENGEQEFYLIIEYYF